MASRPFARRLTVLHHMQRDGCAVKNACWGWRRSPVLPNARMRSYQHRSYLQSPPTSSLITIPTLRRHFSHTPATYRHTQIQNNQKSKMASGNVLQEWFPNTKLPIIISAPMMGSSNGTLAAQVSKAGGFGKPFICLSDTISFLFSTISVN